MDKWSETRRQKILRRAENQSWTYQCVQCDVSMRLRWFSHVERAQKDSWINRCHYLEVEGNAGRGRPRKTWQEVVNRDIKDLFFRPNLGQDL